MNQYKRNYIYQLADLYEPRTIFLQEYRQDTKLKIFGYKSHFLDIEATKNRRLYTISRNDLELKISNTYYQIMTDSMNDQILINVHMPNHLPQYKTTLHNLREDLENTYSGAENIIIGGDWNLDISNPKKYELAKLKKIKKFMREFNLCKSEMDHNTLPTHNDLNGNLNRCIDFFMISKEMKTSIASTQTQTSDYSDHSAKIVYLLDTKKTNFKL